jgi:hypothetical protein
MALHIGDTAPDFEAETLRAESASMSGSATPGRSFSRVERLAILDRLPEEPDDAEAPRIQAIHATESRPSAD